MAALKRFLKSTVGIAVKINAVFYQLTYLVGAFVNKCVYGARCVGLTAGNHGVVVMKLIAVVFKA